MTPVAGKSFRKNYMRKASKFLRQASAGCARSLKCCRGYALSECVHWVSNSSEQGGGWEMAALLGNAKGVFLEKGLSENREQGNRALVAVNF